MRAAIAAALAVAACALPATVHADTANPYLVTQASVCTMTSLTLTTGTPVSALSTVPTTFDLNAQGTCIGVPSGNLSFFGSGMTDGPATCAGFVAPNGVGTITIGGNGGPITFDIAGLTAAPLLTVMGSQAGLTGAGALALSPTSLEACLLGGTTVLQYTGAAVFAL